MARFIVFLIITAATLVGAMALSHNEETKSAMNARSHDEHKGVNEKVEHSPKLDQTSLGNELEVNGIHINDQKGELTEALGNPEKSDDITQDIRDVLYDKKSFLTNKDEIIGLYTQEVTGKTKSGIHINDSVNELLKRYKNREIYKSDGGYYFYDQNYFLTFGAQTNKITSIGLFDRKDYLTLNNFTMNDLLTNSERFSKPITTALKNTVSRDHTVTEDNQTKSQSKEESSTTNTDNGQQDSNQTQLEDGSNQDSNNPFKEENDLARFSKTVKIGDPESVVSNYVGSGTQNYEYPKFTMYNHPPVGFVAEDGAVKLISWGRSGDFEQWKTKENIGRRSTIEETKNAYSDYQYDLMYRKGQKLPSYMVVHYHSNRLVFEFTTGTVSFIFLCSPEMLDESMVKNNYYTYDQLQNYPF